MTMGIPVTSARLDSVVMADWADGVSTPTEVVGAEARQKAWSLSLRRPTGSPGQRVGAF